MLHYSTHVLLDIYPLSEEEYRNQSVRRRASYDYLNQIVEEPYKAIEFIINILRIGVVGRPYKPTLLLAKESGVLPSDVVDSLLYFRNLRNEIVHNNPKANESLLVYPELFKMIILGFALFEVFWAYADCRIESFRSRVNVKLERTVVVDQSYLLKWLQIGIDRGWSDGFFDGFEESKVNAISKLRNENDSTAFVIDIGSIHKRCA